MKRSLVKRSGAAPGFTLLELLIATAVGAIILLVIQTTFFGAMRLHNTTHARTDESLTVERALAIVRRDFAGVMLPGGPISGTFQTTSLSSTVGENFGDRVGADLFTTSGRIDGWTQFSEAQKVAYYLAPAADGRQGVKDLLRVVQRNLLPVQDEAGEPQVLLAGVTEAIMEFYDGAGWTDSWDSDSTESVPTAIKLRITLAAAGTSQPQGAPIELTVPVLVLTSASLQAQLAEEAAQP